eukprot:3983506-Pleurochrysis_carterae.AAC.1
MTRAAPLSSAVALPTAPRPATRLRAAPSARPFAAAGRARPTFRTIAVVASSDSRAPAVPAVGAAARSVGAPTPLALAPTRLGRGSGRCSALSVATSGTPRRRYCRRCRFRRAARPSPPE